MPMPSVLPTITARPKPRPSTRRRPPPDRAALWLESNKDDVDRLVDVAGRVTGAARLELDVARPPSVHDGLAVRRVLDFAARQVHDDRVRGVRVQALARADLHPRTKHG